MPDSISNNRWRSIAPLSALCFLLCACHKLTTITSSRFSEDRFEAILPGMTETEVLQQLGSPLTIYTRVEYDNGSSNNVEGRILPQPGMGVKFYGLHFSAPRHTRFDYRVYEVIISDGRVLKKNTYDTD